MNTVNRAMMRRGLMALTAVLLMLAVAGCTGRMIVITLSPNPVVVERGQTSIPVTVTIKTTGTFGTLRIDEFSVVMYDEAGDVVKEWGPYAVNVTLPMFINGTHSEDIELDITYDQVVEREVAKVVISVTGSDPGTLEVDVIAEDPAAEINE